MISQEIWFFGKIKFICAYPTIWETKIYLKNAFPIMRDSIRLEFLFKASPAILYKFLTTPSCLIRWFSDEVDIQDDVYTFIWSGEEEIATLVEDDENERLRFVWEDAEEGEYLEFKLSTSPVTGETILEIEDFCDADEKEDQKLLWESQIKILRQETGS